MRLIGCICVFLLSVLVVVGHSGGSVFAQTDGGNGFFGTTDPDSGNVAVSATSDSIISSGGSGGRVCRWRWMTVGEVMGLAPPQGPQPPLDVLDDLSVYERGGITYRIYNVVCPTLNEIRLVDPNITPGDLIPGVVDHADDTIELPETLVNPPVTTKGIVNLGMWLAVEEAAYDPITADAGLAWITVTPTIGETRFEFGNGDEKVCEGFGVPIVDLDTLEEGPCGYTYTEPGDYTLTITSTWELPYTSSAGPGALTPMRRTSAYTYDVVEIQTVGVSG